MGEAIKMLLIVATTVSFCTIFPHLFILDDTVRKIAFAFSVLNEVFHVIHYILMVKIKKKHFILGMVFFGACISCMLVDLIFNIVFLASNDSEKNEDKRAIQLILIQSSIVIALNGICVVIQIIRRREQNIKDGLVDPSSRKSQKHSPKNIADHGEGEGEGDLREQTPKTKTPVTDVKSDRRKKDDDSKKDVKKSDRDRSRKDHTDKDRRDRDKSISKMKDGNDRDKTKSGRSEKKDGKSGKSSKDNSDKSKEKSHRKRTSKGDDDRKKSEKEPRKKSSKKSEKSH